MSPLEQIIGWLPFLGWAMGSVAQIERLGPGPGRAGRSEPENAVCDADRRLAGNRAGGRNPCLSPRRAAQRLRARPDRRDDPPRPDRVHHRRQRQRQDHLGQADHRAVPARKRRDAAGRPADHARQPRGLPAVVLRGLRRCRDLREPLGAGGGRSGPAGPGIPAASSNWTTWSR